MDVSLSSRTIVTIVHGTDHLYRQCEINNGWAAILFMYTPATDHLYFLETSPRFIFFVLLFTSLFQVLLTSNSQVQYSHLCLYLLVYCQNKIKKYIKIKTNRHPYCKQVKQFYYIVLVSSLCIIMMICIHEQSWKTYYKLVLSNEYLTWLKECFLYYFTSEKQANKSTVITIYRLQRSIHAFHKGTE